MRDVACNMQALILSPQYGMAGDCSKHDSDFLSNVTMLTSTPNSTDGSDHFINNTIRVVNCHAEGECGDVIVSGISDVPGDTLWEKSRYIAKEDRLGVYIEELEN